METIKFKLVSGPAVMLMHNGDLANPFNPFTQELGRLNTAKKKKGADKLAVLAEMARVEFQGGLYHADDIGPFLPAKLVRGALVSGAKMTKGGATVQRAVQCVGGRFKLEYDGPRDREGLWADKSFVHQEMVKVGQARVLRTRPMFTNWSVVVEFAYDPSACAADDLIRWMGDASRFHGVGDNRKNGYGRFTPSVIVAKQALAAK